MYLTQTIFYIIKICRTLTSFTNGTVSSALQCSPKPIPKQPMAKILIIPLPQHNHRQCFACKEPAEQQAFAKNHSTISVACCAEEACKLLALAEARSRREQHLHDAQLKQKTKAKNGHGKRKKPFRIDPFKI